MWRGQHLLCGLCGCARHAEVDVCGVCIGDGIMLGVHEPLADNDMSALADDGSCTYGNGLCTGLSYDLMAAIRLERVSRPTHLCELHISKCGGDCDVWH